MVRRRYVGFGDPVAAFERLRPFHKELIALRTQVRPFGPEYLVLSAVLEALQTAAFHFTGNSAFYASKPHG